MKLFFTIALILLLPLSSRTQHLDIDSAQISFTYHPNTDSLKQLLPQLSDDTTKANLLGVLSWRYCFTQADTALIYGKKGIELSQRINYKKGVAFCTQTYAFGFWALGNYNTSLQLALDALHQSEELNDNKRIAFSHLILGSIYRDFGDYDRALSSSYKGTELSLKSDLLLTVGYAMLGSVYELQNRLDSAQFFVRKAHQLNLKVGEGKWGWIYSLMGNIERKNGNYQAALRCYQTALPLIKNMPKDIVDVYNSLAIIHKETGDLDSAVFFANEVLQKYKSISYQKGVLDAVNILAEVYKAKKETDSTLKYFELGHTLNNRLFNQKNERDIQNLAFNEQLRLDEIIRERNEFRNKVRMYGLLAGGIIFMVVAFLLWRNNQHRRKAYALLQKQKQETDTQKAKVEQTLQELKSTQAQLIQSEKMASLGELTAGIAHEIQNPLNFVNNFSEVNAELVEELQNERLKGKSERDEALEVDIINDIKTNLEKISHHGKRADAIVKGMLQHSRVSTGQKQLTDINSLCDEYLRLAYHGLRAKDKSFSAKCETHFDNSIEKVNIVPQDIGRVLLNMINNAFYAVNEKVKLQVVSYEPVVTVSTKKLGNKIEIKVADNGNGIPQNIVDKIFQPFFTTKPTGEGTGLGLSLAYDIIKAHDGEINVNTKEGEGSEFVIQITGNG